MSQVKRCAMPASSLSGQSLLQTHPDLAVWPANEVLYLLPSQESPAPARFDFSPAAVKLLLRFLQPTRVAEVFPHAANDELEVLRRCVAMGLLVFCSQGAAMASSGRAKRQTGFLLSELAAPLPPPERIHQAVVRHEVIEQRNIYVLDGLFTDEEVASIHRWMQRLPFILADYDTEPSREVLHWIYELPGIRWLIQIVPFLRALAHAADVLFAGERLELQRAHVNNTRYGDLQLPHRDAEDASVTLLYFANPAWETAWMGETVFYEGQGEPLYTVMPRPGRVLAFHGELLHRGGVPSRSCHEPRLSLACKFHSHACLPPDEGKIRGEDAGQAGTLGGTG